MTSPAPDSANANNPFFRKWDTPFGIPPFQEIRPEHYLPAIRAGIRRQNEELRGILKTHAPPSFRNSVEALEDSGTFLDRVLGVFSALSEADTSDPLQAIALAVGPMLARHEDEIYLNPALFQRVRAVHAGPRDGLGPESCTLLDKLYRRFLRSGADLAPGCQARLREVHTELALLGQRFKDNLHRATNAFHLRVERREELEGLDPGHILAAREAARMAGEEGCWLFDLHAPSLWPLLEHARNRDLRRRMLSAYLARCGPGSPEDNTGIAARIAGLRGEKARLLGYPTFAHYALEEDMTGTPDEAYRLLDQVWAPSLARAKAEAEELQALLEQDHPGCRLEPWDWRYYADKVRRARFGLDANALRPYFPLDQVREGAFRTANRLYGITFNERHDLPTYHPEVRAFLVQDRDGGFLGIYLADYHVRPGKHGGAWMDTFRRQWRHHGREVRPIVYNVANFGRPLGEVPALLTLEEVRTLFHEFGHALHSLLSRCRYRSLSGTATALDFSEMPSQIMEHWAVEPEVLAGYARHYRTGGPLSPELLARIQQARCADQGFATTEYLAAAYLDMDWHSLADERPVDGLAFEAASMARIGLLPEIPPRHRTPYFAQSMGGEYAAGYYGYLWSAVLGADAFDTFEEQGDIFHGATARSFRANLLEKGGSEDPMALYTRFRGRPPLVAPLLRKRGLG